jgi:hypothetical protein
MKCLPRSLSAMVGMLLARCARMRTSKSPLLFLLLGAGAALLVACTTTSSTTPADAGPQAETGADASPSDGSPSDAAAVACSAPLTDDIDFDTAPIAAWCATSNGRGGKSTRACDGYLSIIFGEGVDCNTQYIFDATTKKLVAQLRECNNPPAACTKGPSRFVLPGTHCIDNGDWGSQAITCPDDAGTDAQGDAQAD